MALTCPKWGPDWQSACRGGSIDWYNSIDRSIGIDIDWSSSMIYQSFWSIYRSIDISIILMIFMVWSITWSIFDRFLLLCYFFFNSNKTLMSWTCCIPTGLRAMTILNSANQSEFLSLFVVDFGEKPCLLGPWGKPREAFLRLI